MNSDEKDIFGSDKTILDATLELAIGMHKGLRIIERLLASSEEYGMTLTDFRVLSYLISCTSGNCNISSAADFLDVAKTTIGYSFNKLEKKDWLERREGERADQPSFYLTDQGKRAWEQISRQFIEGDGGITEVVEACHEAVIIAQLGFRKLHRFAFGEEFADRSKVESEMMAEQMRRVLRGRDLK